MANQLNRLLGAELAKRYRSGTDFVVVGHNKLTGPETTQLRKTLRDRKIRLEVVKNSVAARVLEAEGLGAGVKYLQGPSALATGELEMPELCRVLTEHARKLESRFFIRGGVMGGAALDVDGIVMLASIPPLPVLHAKIAGSIQAPVARVAGAFQSILRSLACAMDGIRQQKESSSPPPAPQAAASGPAPGGAA